ncbi:hypothetical protein SAMN05444274_11017 [Mariniphaga anaerophila]|uniref:Uncharacterized protein n=1 Tax=Mariniphaga anaerophila TaxID=1484053 RepID=A0A1M5ETB9_9BACT|nr:hypothetical protein SAMN05444274_11017 [Mariniphaga anaerophila]
MKFIRVQARRITENSQTKDLPKETEFFINSNIIKTIDPIDYKITLMEDEYNVHNDLVKIGIADYEISLVNHLDLDSLILK